MLGELAYGRECVLDGEIVAMRSGRRVAALGRGSLTGTVGALLLGAYTSEGHLVYLGHVSSELTHAQRRVLADGLPELELDECPFTPAPTHTRVVRWVEPLIVIDVAYRELTKDGRLRAPEWRGVRADIEPSEVVIPSEPQP